MNIHRKLVTLVTALAFLSVLPVIHAAEGDQASKLTFTKSVQIPGRVLPAGTYWFVLADTPGNTNIIQVFNADRSMLYATLLTIGETRSQATDNTAITFVNRGSMQPETLVSWFYPGRTDGHEFVYSQPEEQQLAQLKHRTVMATAQAKQPAQGVVAGD